MGPLGLAVLAFLALSPAPYPPGTVTFSKTRAEVAVAAADGGVWVGTSDGRIVHYTAAGAGVAIGVPCCRVNALALAPDGTLWFSSGSVIGRVDGTGTVLEQYAVSADDIAVASDGALWYLRVIGVVGRIAGGSVTTVAAPSDAWKLAPASGGDVWVLGFGFGVDNLYRLTPSGAISATPLPYDTFAAEMRALRGTLFIGTRTWRGVMRRSVTGTFTLIPDVPAKNFVPDDSGNLWATFGAALTYVDASGMPRVTGELPSAEWCGYVRAIGYAPLAVDDAGGVWLRTLPLPAPLPGGTACTDPLPPLPDLVRIDAARFVTAYALAQSVPAVSPFLLAVLAVVLSLAAVWQARP